MIRRNWHEISLALCVLALIVVCGIMGYFIERSNSDQGSSQARRIVTAVCGAESYRTFEAAYGFEDGQEQRFLADKWVIHCRPMP